MELINISQRFIITLGVCERMESFVSVKTSGNVNFRNLTRRRPNFISTFLSKLKFKADWNVYFGWLVFFNLVFYNNRIYICCFAKFQLYRLEDGVIILLKQNNGHKENAHLMYYFQFDQNYWHWNNSFWTTFDILAFLSVIFASFK